MVLIKMKNTVVPLKFNKINKTASYKVCFPF